MGPRISGRESVIVTFTVKPATKKISILLFKKSNKKLFSTVELTKDFSVGRVYSVQISGVAVDELCYLLKEDNESYVDPYATAIVGRDAWGDIAGREKHQYKIYSSIAHIEKDWKDTKVVVEPSDMVFYKLHLRGFTAGWGMSEAKVGSYKGLTSKLSYLKKLGVTSIELMPLYDFEELILENKTNISPKGKVTNTGNMAIIAGGLSIIIDVVHKLLRMLLVAYSGVIVFLYILAGILSVFALFACVKNGLKNKQITLDAYITGISFVTLILI